MENQEQEQKGFTKDNEGLLCEGQGVEQVFISAQEATEYRDYKRQKKRAEIMAALSKSEGVLADKEDAGRIGDRAVKLRQAAVLLTPTRLESSRESFMRRLVVIDCIIGGTGDSLSKVKAYEGKTAVKMGAREITLRLSAYQIEHCRYVEIKKEIKQVLRAAKKAKVKVAIDKQYPRANLSRLIRLCCELGVAYFCVPYFEGCELLRMDMSANCKLQVSGVETLEQYRRLMGAGVGRIVTTRALDIYNEWMLEVEKIDFPSRKNETENPLQGAGEMPLSLPPILIGREPMLPIFGREKSAVDGHCLLDKVECESV